jgi:hypothetical protein
MHADNGPGDGEGTVKGRNVWVESHAQSYAQATDQHDVDLKMMLASMPQSPLLTLELTIQLLTTFAPLFGLSLRTEERLIPGWLISLGLDFSYLRVVPECTELWHELS